MDEPILISFGILLFFLHSFIYKSLKRLDVTASINQLRRYVEDGNPELFDSIGVPAAVCCCCTCSRHDLDTPPADTHALYAAHGPGRRAPRPHCPGLETPRHGLPDHVRFLSWQVCAFMLHIAGPPASRLHCRRMCSGKRQMHCVASPAMCCGSSTTADARPYTTASACDAPECSASA